MRTVDDLDQVLYEQLLDYKSAAANAAFRFKDQTSEEVRMKLYRADGRLRYWVFVYIAAIDLFSPDPLDFERESSCQAEILRHCKDCGRPELLELFPKARDISVRHAFEPLADGAAFEQAPDRVIKAGTVRKLECTLDSEAGNAELSMRICVSVSRLRR